MTTARAAIASTWGPVRILAGSERDEAGGARARAERGGVRPSRPAGGAGEHAARAVRRDPRRAEAELHPPPAREGADRGAAVGAGLRHRQDLLRRAAAAHDGARRVPERGPRLPVPPAPRHVVLGAPSAAQLVAAGLRSRVARTAWRSTRSTSTRPIRNSSAGYDYDEWSRTGRQQAAKQVKKETRKQPQAEEPLEPRARCPRRDPAGRHDRLLGRAAALDRAEHHEPHALQHRLPHGQPGRPGRGRRRRRTSTRSARARRCATSCARATSSHCPRRSSPRTTNVPGWPRQPGDRLPLRAAARRSNGPA